MTSPTSAAARPPDPWRDALEPLGATFMTSTLIRSASKEAGMPGSALYFRGRVGVLGDVAVDTAYDVLAIFPRRVVDVVWERSADVPAADAVAAYVDVIHRWGRENVVDDEASERAATLMENAVDAWRLPPMLIAQGHQRLARPDDVPARLVQAATTVREIRGALYFAALGLVGLSVPRAMLVDPGAGPGTMGRLGWKSEEVDAARAEQRAGDEARQRDAQSAADAAFVGLLGDVIGEDGVAELGASLLAVQRVETPPPAG